MTCDEFAERLAPWLAGTLSDAEAREVEQHAAACDACGAQLDAASRLEELPSEIAPRPALRSATMRAIATRRIGSRRRSWMTGIAAIAALAFLAVGLQPHGKSAQDFPGAGRVLLAIDHAKPQFAELDAAERDLDAALVDHPGDAELAAARQRVRRQRDFLQGLVAQVTK